LDTNNTGLFKLSQALGKLTVNECLSLVAGVDHMHSSSNSSSVKGAGYGPESDGDNTTVPAPATQLSGLRDFSSISVEILADGARACVQRAQSSSSSGGGGRVGSGSGSGAAVMDYDTALHHIEGSIIVKAHNNIQLVDWLTLLLGFKERSVL
jgi:hypothetical protein